MSDLFHEKVPLTFIQRVFETMANCPQHRFQVLTKRNDRLRKLAAELPWPDNVWMGVSVENARVLHRVDDLRTVPAAVRFLSCEPLLGSLAGINLADIHWVIAGGESGLKSRPMDPAWPLQLRDDCEAMDVPFFFKQWGGVNKKAAGRILDGMTYSGMPENGVSEEGQDSPDATGARSNDRSAQQPEDFLEENEVLALDGLELREQCTGGTAAKEPCRVPDCRQLLVLSIDMLITLEWR